MLQDTTSITPLSATENFHIADFQIPSTAPLEAEKGGFSRSGSRNGEVQLGSHFHKHIN